MWIMFFGTTGDFYCQWSWGTDPLLLNLGIRWEWVSFIAALLSKIEFSSPFRQVTIWASELVWIRLSKENPCSYWEINSIVQSIASNITKRASISHEEILLSWNSFGLWKF